ncbi:MAG TPA: UDP-N-acetylglucosamine 2-epimerase (non-hydrolyzing) [Planctomycetota bacterium]|nr:UDP-N-acetylglucosamine 2-epimerase (non-hydrolyzing) [Planctomycetota bacterium]
MSPARGRWLAVAGARPNLVKLAPLVRAARRARHALPWVHTGQHWDEALSDSVRRDVGLPAPCENLEVGPGDPAAQTARILERLAPVLVRRRPSVVVVVGDVTSTVAAAVAAAHAGVPVAHVESGLRSFDPRMVEERNRILVDRLSDRLYVTEPVGAVNLRREGVPRHRVRLVGSPLADALAAARPALARRSGPPRGEALATLHRAENVDDRRRLTAWCRALADLARRVPVRFPVHPRTRDRLDAWHLRARLEEAGVTLDEPLAYLDFLAALAGARLVLTDSGGVPEEASILGIPCLTLRGRTEKPWTLSHGTNRLAGEDPRRLAAAVRSILERPPRPRAGGLVWDGHASERIVADLARHYV